MSPASLLEKYARPPKNWLADSPNPQAGPAPLQAGGGLQLPEKYIFIIQQRPEQPWSQWVLENYNMARSFFFISVFIFAV